MNLVTLFILQDGQRDETIRIAKVANADEMFRVTYTPREGRATRYQFQLHRSQVSDYIYDVLRLLQTDMYPYDSIQVMTAHMPSVAVSVLDLGDDSVRSLVERAVLGGLDANIVKRNSDDEYESS